MFYKYKKLSKFLIYICFSSFFFITLCGCAGRIKDTKPIVNNIVNEANEEEPALKHDGSLWQDGGLLSELFVNSKARKIGDIVTIKIIESSSASNRAATNTGRSSSLSMGIDNLFGLEGRYDKSSPASKSPHPFFNPFARANGDLSSTFDGSGTTTRRGDLTAYITAMVTKVLPNGNLEIVGTREVTVNNEEQTITLSGIIRPRDVSPDNVILSTYISDARIAYSGSGIINDRQRPGWMARILDWVWPL
ncbi:MAG: flagellar basal body L-ring protein FlgH [Deltaproteobacteria bacterium]|nr:flagellar basal body L-ring protein FlgH [Deltaproteobacteria bacterium]